MILVDLHLHTTLSDGKLTPTQLVDLAAKRGLRVIAITDHDSTEGLAEALKAAQRHPQLRIIPGIELSTDIPENEVHLLGYFIDYHNADFQRILTEFREGRQDRGRKMVEKLAEMGIHVSWERVKELSDGGAIGRPHIAQAMLEKGYISTLQEAFTRYIGRNGPAYAERVKLTPSEAVKMVLQVRGLPVLAHPMEVEDREKILPELKKAGLIGMEVFYGYYTPDQVKYLEGLAKKWGLVPCGGSDYHANGTPAEPEPGMVGPPMETADVLFKLAAKKHGSIIQNI